MGSGLTLREYPEEDKPRERLYKIGAGTLSDAELLAIILKTGRRGENVLELSRNILSKYCDGNIFYLCKLTEHELKRIPGIGEAKAAQVIAACELAKRITTEKDKGRGETFSTVESLGEYIVRRLKWLEQEVLLVVMFDAKWHILKELFVSKGTVDQSLVHPREVFSEAVRNRASSIVIAHNHPSGDPSPSSADFKTTRRIYDAGRILGIELVDHIIVGNNEYYSMLLKGDLKRIKK